MRFINEYFPKKTNCNKKEVKECLIYDKYTTAI